MAEQPIATDTNGRFQPGNQAAVGHSSRSQKLRMAMICSITESDVQAITAKLIDQARGGDIKSATLLLGYIGKPTATEEPASSPERSVKVLEIAERIRQSRLLAGHELTG